MSEPSDRVREALARRALATPEAPFLFFRSPRGSFTWWSCARVASAFGREAGDDSAAAVPAELFAHWRAVDTESLARSAELAKLATGGPPRPIWISARPLGRVGEAALALAAALEGWALVREPGERLHPELFLWARPTLVAGSAEEILALARAALAAAPRFRRSRWLARRVARLGLVLVEPPGSAEELDSIRRAFAELGAAPRVLPFPGGGW